MLKLPDFLKLTDNNTASMVGCRYFNKSISLCKLIIITSVYRIEDFNKTPTDNYAESQHQVFRRLPTNIIMSDEYIKFRKYDRMFMKYMEDFRIPNPITEMYQQTR